LIFLLDLANLLVCLLIIIITLRFKIIPTWIGVILIIESFIPYFLNDILFPASYMSDQFRYFETVKELRNFNFNYDENHKVLITGWILSFLPLPFAETINSIGFYNRFMYLVIFIWLYKKNFLSGIPLYILLFYPSLLLYTSLSLRDPLIMILMILIVIFFLEKKYIFSISITILLYFIKFQNFFLMIAFLLFFTILKKETLFYRLRYIILFFIILIIFPFSGEIIAALNFYRRAMFLEDGGNIEIFLPISHISDLIILGLSSVPYFLLKPFIWESTNLFQIIQSFENIILLIILYFFILQAYRKDSFITIKWLIFLVFSLSIYGLVVYNFGTAARYKFPFIIIFTIGLSYEIYKLNGYKFARIFK